MKRLLMVQTVLILLIFTFSSCSVILALAGVSSDQCERYSVYRSTIFGEDELLWEETACDYGSTDLETRGNEKLAYYTDFYSCCTIYREHVTYNQ